MSKLKALSAVYLAAILGFFLYTFTQVDLSLTLSKASVFQVLQKQLQYIGFFQRPLSALIFLIISLFLFISYIGFIIFAKKGILKIRHTAVLIFLTFIILVFSYNAFSYDLFNYIFDAKIITFYHQNPYFSKASDFVSDPMLNFMRWTHRLYPYGPVWLFLTVPLSFFGFGFFLPTFFLFKLLAGFSYLGSCFLVYKISEKIFPKEKILNLVFWAFNPLVILEGLISSHNDIVMLFFMYLSIYTFLERKKISALLYFLLSIGIKFETLIFSPLAIYIAVLEKNKKKIYWENIVKFSVILSLIAVMAVIARTTFQPWYLLFPISLAVFLAKKNYIFITTLTLSVFVFLIYGVYVYMTDYAKAYPDIILQIEIVGFVTAVLSPVVYVFFVSKFIKTDLLGS